LISEVMENGARHTLQIGSDCLGVKGESFTELGGSGGVERGGGVVLGQNSQQVPVLVCRSGVWPKEEGLVLHYHVVGMSLTSQGSGG